MCCPGRGTNKLTCVQHNTDGCVHRRWETRSLSLPVVHLNPEFTLTIIIYFLVFPFGLSSFLPSSSYFFPASCHILLSPFMFPSNCTTPELCTITMQWEGRDGIAILVHSFKGSDQLEVFLCKPFPLTPYLKKKCFAILWFFADR